MARGAFGSSGRRGLLAKAGDSLRDYVKRNSAVIPTNRAITAKEADLIVTNMVKRGIRPDKAIEDLNRKAREKGNQF